MKDATFVALLERAKKHLARTRRQYYRSGSRFRRYICTALDDALAHVPGATHADVEDLQYLIADRLERHVALEGWLMERGHLELPIDSNISHKDFAKLQRTRLAWIDSLIKEFS